jgi:hypothetical protein
MLGLGWFDPSGASINWHHFAGTKTTNAETSETRDTPEHLRFQLSGSLQS